METYLLRKAGPKQQWAVHMLPTPTGDENMKAGLSIKLYRIGFVPHIPYGSITGRYLKKE